MPSNLEALSIGGDGVQSTTVVAGTTVETALPFLAASEEEYSLSASIPDVTAVDTRYIAIPDGGNVVKIISAIEITIVGNLAITGKIGGTAIAGGAISVTAAGSAAGDVDSVSPVDDDTRRVESDGTVELEFDGTPTVGGAVNVTVVIRRGVPAKLVYVSFDAVNDTDGVVIKPGRVGDSLIDSTGLFLDGRGRSHAILNVAGHTHLLHRGISAAGELHIVPLSG